MSTQFLGVFAELEVADVTHLSNPTTLLGSLLGTVAMHIYWLID